MVGVGVDCSDEQMDMRSPFYTVVRSGWPWGVVRILQMMDIPNYEYSKWWIFQIVHRHRAQIWICSRLSSTSHFPCLWGYASMPGLGTRPNTKIVLKKFKQLGVTWNRWELALSTFGKSEDRDWDNCFNLQCYLIRIYVFRAVLLIYLVECYE